MPPQEVDVLIVGCGPAGLTLATQLAAFDGIRTCIIDQKDGPLLLGQADGIACRTVEMFEAFVFSERVLKESCWIHEVTFWKPDPRNPARLTRHGRVQDTENGLSEFPHVILNQARVHDFYLDRMRHLPARLEPYYGWRLADLSVDAQATDHPVSVTLERVDPAGDKPSQEAGIDRAAPSASAPGRTQLKARYVVGCDGARSAVRRSIGLQLTGDSANQAWGVMDVLAITDFPDIRFKAAVQSREGNLLVIPREGGYLVRLYVEMDELAPGERVADRAISLDQLVSKAQRILSPYRLDVQEVAWWSVYEIGQRLCDRFDDLGPPAPALSDRGSDRGSDGVPDGARVPRVFIAGDACHTHSPKAGQGMNVSMQDSFNLGWKLAAVLRGRARADILATYSRERQAVARELIDFDREWARMFSEQDTDPAAFQAYFQGHGRYTAGVETHYRPSILCGEARHQALATGFTVGKRFHSARVLRVCDGHPMHLGHAGKADGRWRLYAFAAETSGGEPSARGGGRGARVRIDAGLLSLCHYLQHDHRSPLRRTTRADEDLDAVLDVRAVLPYPHPDIDLLALPELLRPPKGRYRLIDPEKVFSSVIADYARHPGAGEEDIYALRGIDRKQGALVVVRPDQYVAQVLPLSAHEELAAFFAAFMLPG